jgi:hypothetical protein
VRKRKARTHAGGTARRTNLQAQLFGHALLHLLELKLLLLDHALHFRLEPLERQRLDLLALLRLPLVALSLLGCRPHFLLPFELACGLLVHLG